MTVFRFCFALFFTEVVEPDNPAYGLNARAIRSNWAVILTFFLGGAMFTPAAVFFGKLLWASGNHPGGNAVAPADAKTIAEAPSGSAMASPPVRKAAALPTVDVSRLMSGVVRPPTTTDVEHEEPPAELPNAFFSAAWN